MNVFCLCLASSICKKFRIEAEVFVSKKKKLVHTALEKPLISYYFFDELINFVEQYWEERKFSFKDYYFNYPRLNQSLKWKNDYMFFQKRIKNKRNR